MSIKRIFALLVALFMCFALCINPVAETDAAQDVLTVLFTHDLHSHLLPAANETGEGEYGGYARLMSAIKAEKEKDPDAILVDGGDFSMSPGWG